MKLLLAFLFAASSLLAAPVSQWGPVSRPLNDGAFAKEGLDTDKAGLSYSVGFATGILQPSPHVLFSVRDGAGSLLGTGYVPANCAGPGVDSCYTGVDAEAGGAFCYTVGTCFPQGINGAASSLLIVKWQGPWTNPTVAWSVTHTVPGALQTSGCRVIIPPNNGAIIDKLGVPQNVVFAAGCTETANFVMCLNMLNGSLVPNWGAGGMRVISSASCPKHLMPGIFPSQPIFANCRQSFLELSGNTMYLGGTATSGGQRYFEVSRVMQTGAGVAGNLVFPFLTKTFLTTPGNGMKALSVSGNQGTALVAAVGGDTDVGWRATGGPPVFTLLGLSLVVPPAVTMNDVESVPGTLLVNGNLVAGNYVHIGGRHAANGQVFRFWYPLAGGNNAAAMLQFVRDYGAPANAANEVYDLAIGDLQNTPNWTFATGGVVAGGSYDAPLLEVHPSGTPFPLAAPTNLANPAWPDRGNAVRYDASLSPPAFTHGNQREPVPNLYHGRNVRWNP